MHPYIYSVACEAYKKVCDEHITVYDKEGNEYTLLAYCVPSFRLSKLGRKYLYLRNCNGPLARYNLQTGEITV